MTVTISDDFTAADSTTAVWNDTTATGRVTPVGAKTWAGVGVPLGDDPTPRSGAHWGITSNRASRSTSENAAVYIDTGQADGTFEVDLITGTSLNDSGVIFRLVDANNWLRVIADPGGWYLQRKVGGTQSNVGNAGACAANTTYALKILLAGTSIKVYVANVLTLNLTVTDAAILNATKIGLYNSGGTTTHKWDNVAWTPPPTPPGVPTSVAVDQLAATSARLTWQAPAP